MLTVEQLENLNNMILTESELALLMAYIHHNSGNHLYVKMISNASPLFEKHCSDLQSRFAQETLNSVMLKRVELQKEISKFVTMSFRDVSVNLKDH